MCIGTGDIIKMAPQNSEKGIIYLVNGLPKKLPYRKMDSK